MLFSSLSLQFEQAAKIEAQRIHSRREDGSEPDVKNVQVLLYKSGPGGEVSGAVSMREVKPEQYISRLVIIPGIVTAASRPKHKATQVTLQCRTCKATKIIACSPGMGGTVLPRKCDSAQLPGAGRDACGLDPYTVLVNHAQCFDQQTLKLQERPEDVPTGDLPRSMLCLVDRKLCSTVSPGMRVTAVGILSVFQGKDGAGGNRKDKQGSVAVRTTQV